MEEPHHAMGPSIEFYAVSAGIVATTIGSAAWWRVRALQRKELEAKQLEVSVPSSRDGLLLAALVIEIYNDKGTVSWHEPWLGDLWVMLDGVVAKHQLRKVGSYQSMYMVAATEQRVAEEALMLTAITALDIRDAIQLFVTSRNIKVYPKFGIHADIVPTVGLGSTISLSQLWNKAMELAAHGNPGTIELSLEAAEWLGPNFNIEQMGEHPVLHTRKSA